MRIHVRLLVVVIFVTDGSLSVLANPVILKSSRPPTLVLCLKMGMSSLVTIILVSFGCGLYISLSAVRMEILVFSFLCCKVFVDYCQENGLLFWKGEESIS